MSRPPFIIVAALLALTGCGDGGTGPADPADGRRIAAQFENLADAVGDSGTSPTADALRHAAEVVRLVGHATPVTLTIDGVSQDWLAVAEQLDFPELQCTWPADTGVVVPGDSVVPEPVPPDGGSEGGGGGDGGEGECTVTGIHSMRTLIAWEPERMAQVARVFAEPGESEVRSDVPDVMAGLPEPTEPGDSVVSGGGGTVEPGFMGEYLVGDDRIFITVEGSQSNALEEVGGACTSDRATFDWAEFSCEAARIRFGFAMRVEEVRYEPLMERPSMESAEGEGESHTLSLASSAVDGVRLTVVAWTPPPMPPEPGPGPDPLPGPVDSSTVFH